MKFHGDGDLEQKNIAMEETKSKDLDKKNNGGNQIERPKQEKHRDGGNQTHEEDCFRLPLGWCFCYGTQVFHSRV